MKAVLFMHNGWTVAASSWTVASKNQNTVEIVYPWSATNGIGWTDLATGCARTTINLPMEAFLERVRVTRSDFVDLRSVTE